ncbi:phage holin family protein [Tistrella bauzanensis]|uniref:phage holin family protein n=1 Tax=Tistrella TaxID=171436 RepID=UPI0031F6A3FA
MDIISAGVALWREASDIVWRLSDAVGLTVLAAYIGRLLFHVGEVQRGRRTWWSRHLIWEVIAAVGIGLIADGVAAYAGLLDGPVRIAVVVGLSYLGPRGVQDIILRIVAARTGGRV